MWAPLPLRILIFPFLPVLGATVYRHLGRLWAIAALGLPLLIMHLALEGMAGSALWLGQWVALGPILVETLARPWDLNRAMAAALLATLGLQGSLLGFWAMEEGAAPWTLLAQNMEAAFQQALGLYGQGAMTAEEMTRMRAGASRLAQVAVVVVPGVFVSMDLLLHWWSLLVCRRFPALWGGVAPGPERLDEWGIPYPWVWVTILGGVLVLLPVEILGAVGINLLIAMGSAHLLQGIAVVASVFRQRRVPPFFRGLVYAAVFLQQVFLLAVVAIGLFDVWFDFRKRWGTPTFRA